MRQIGCAHVLLGGLRLIVWPSNCHKLRAGRVLCPQDRELGRVDDQCLVPRARLLARLDLLEEVGQRHGEYVLVALDVRVFHVQLEAQVVAVVEAREPDDNDVPFTRNLVDVLLLFLPVLLVWCVLANQVFLRAYQLD